MQKTVASSALDTPVESPADAVGTAAPETATTWQQQATSVLAAALPWLVFLWMAGVLALSLRYLAGWTYTIRLRRRGIREVGQRWHEQLARLAEALGVAAGRPARFPRRGYRFPR